MAVACLALNAVLYVALGLWCALDPATTARFVGLQPTGPAGQSEWLAVYGGLELGLGAFFAVAALRPALRSAGLLFALCLYAGIVVLRSTAALQLGFASLGNARGMWVLEVLLLALAAPVATSPARPGTP
ncbi:MAG: DUF4345 family protein [Planctomycetia bacterium]